MEIKSSAGEVLRLPTRKASLVLAALALAARGVPRQRLCDAFWADREEAQARSSLRQALAAIRRVVSNEDSGILIEGDGETVKLAARPEDVDVRLFDQLSEQGEPHDLAKTADCYQGDILAGIGLAGPLDQWFAPYRRSYRHKALLLVERLSLLVLGGPDLKVVEAGCQALAERLLSIDP